MADLKAEGPMIQGLSYGCYLGCRGRSERLFTDLGVAGCRHGGVGGTCTCGAVVVAGMGLGWWGQGVWVRCGTVLHMLFAAGSVQYSKRCSAVLPKS